MAKVVLGLSPLFSCLFITLWLVIRTGRAASVDPFEQVMPNFYAVDVLDDGQVERRFFLDGIALKETAAVYTLNSTKEGAILRQMTDGRHLIQLIYDANQSLLDCEYDTDDESVRQFQKNLEAEYRKLSSISLNTKVRVIENRSDLPEDLARLAVYHHLKTECRRLHNRMRKAARRSRNHSSNRRRRDTDELFMIPHTKWCGKGNRADGPSHLGGYAAADRCCRQHDQQCPHYISAWSEKFGLYNSRSYTAMHCTCDDRFRSCLKQANTAASNLVGKLFFNIIQTKCFVLKPEKVCKKSSWWGKCTQSEWKKKAYLRDPIPY